MQGEFRISRDSLGEVKVPKDAYYGAQTQRAIENFPISGLRLPRRFIRAQGIIKYSAAYANSTVGDLDQRLAEAIMKAAEEVIEGKWDHQFVVDVYQAGAGTSQNMNANEVIANRAIELMGGEKGDTSIVHPNDHVNMAQSTNDTIHVAINIAAVEAVYHDLIPELDGLIETLEQKGRDFYHIIKSGRTHLQDAVPMRLGQEFYGYKETLVEAKKTILESLDLLYQIGFGGNAVGTGINAHPKYSELAIEKVAEITGFPFRNPSNRFMFMQNTQGAIKLSGALKNLAIHLIKIASDLRLLSSGPRTGLAEITLPPVQPGSSIMPGKVNPVMAEMMNMIGSQVIGNDATITSAGQASQLELNVMMPVIAYNLLHSLQILSNGIKVFNERSVKGIMANEKRCNELMEQSLALATALNPAIGYDKAAEIAKKAYAKGKTIREVVREEGILSEEQIDYYLDVKKMV
ncbi:class II fumarate hydratase [Tepidibacillus fermentans]|uniref:Fumarate hydratase class II n=1 Tax=Tepidibacillus fermentans TaxID=1281767 RepID=A0A4R3KGV4_9BACI|nr:class II fumarate hydratase [Tepidibacillus fermentans]TCS82587.1 fumarase class II [Tepidibacillus fermentans]